MAEKYWATVVGQGEPHFINVGRHPNIAAAADDGVVLLAGSDRAARALAAVVAVMVVALMTVNVVTAVPPMVTAVAPVRLVPVMVTAVPPRVVPVGGAMAVTVGAGVT